MPTVPPELLSVAALHAHLGVGTREARFITRHVQHAYQTALIPKRRGGQRSLMVPDARLKHLQRKLLMLLDPLHRPRPAVHGFVSGKSPITNADAHQGRPFLLNLDIENYFGVISRRRVRGMLRAIGLTSPVADAVCDLTVVANQLPQGAPTSPLLANLVTYRLDKDLTAFAKGHRIRYTRYADDVTFSSWARPDFLFVGGEPDPGTLPVDRLDPTLLAIFASNGFALNADKVRWAGSKTRKEVTGLVVNKFTNLRRTFVRNVRSSLYRMEQLGIGPAQAEFSARYGSTASLEAVVRGRLSWIAQVRTRSFAPYRSLAARFNRLYPGTPLPIDPIHDELLARATFVLEYSGPGSEMGQGTAFFLEGVGLVTAHHVLAGMTKPWADLYRWDEPGRMFRARFSGRFCAHRDLAILDHDVPLAEQVSLKAATAEDRLRSLVTAVGFPEHAPGAGVVQREGRIIGRGTRSLVRYVEVDMIVGDGFSGGPIINDRYEVVAVINRGGFREAKQIGIAVSELDGL